MREHLEDRSIERGKEQPIVEMQGIKARAFHSVLSVQALCLTITAGWRYGRTRKVSERCPCLSDYPLA